MSMLALNLFLARKKLWYSLYVAPEVLLVGVGSLLPIPVLRSRLVEGH